MHVYILALLYISNILIDNEKARSRGRSIHQTQVAPTRRRVVRRGSARSRSSSHRPSDGWGTSAATHGVHAPCLSAALACCADYSASANMVTGAGDPTATRKLFEEWCARSEADLLRPVRDRIRRRRPRASWLMQPLVACPWNTDRRARSVRPCPRRLR
jgi:hypothetical protein